MLRHYPKGLLSTPLQVRDASFAFRYGSGASVDVSARGHGLGGHVGVAGRVHLTDRAPQHDARLRAAGACDRDVLGLGARALAGARQVAGGGVSGRLAGHRPPRRAAGRHGHGHPHRRRVRAGPRRPLPVPLHRARDALSVAGGDLGPDRRLGGRDHPHAAAFRPPQGARPRASPPRRAGRSHPPAAAGDGADHRPQPAGAGRLGRPAALPVGAGRDAGRDRARTAPPSGWCWWSRSASAWLSR